MTTDAVLAQIDAALDHLSPDVMRCNGPDVDLAAHRRARAAATVKQVVEQDEAIRRLL